MEAPAGWKLVPVEMTNEMHQACNGALYRHIAGLEQAARDKAKGFPRGYRVGRRMKQSLRWKAMLDAAPEFLTIAEGASASK